MTTPASSLPRCLQLRRVTRGPTLEPGQLRLRAAGSLPSPLDHPGVRFYGYGRMALYQGLKTLGIRAGESVLLPSFICRGVLAPFRALGIAVRYYEVDDRLEPRLETAAGSLDGHTRALLAVHYFGFPHDTEALQAFCQRHQLAYIEDNAHGFISAAGARPLGTFGDIAIFSFRKTLPLPHGAALVLNRPDLVLPPPVPHSRGLARNLAGFALRIGIRDLEIATRLDLVSWLRRNGDCPDANADERARLAEWDRAYSTIADAIARRIDLDRERRIRRRSFAFWLEQSGDWARWGAEPLDRELLPEVVPYALPVRVRDREGFLKALRWQGISCFTWPDFPREVRARGTYRELILVPVHRYPLKGHPE
jgi:perosamine synthetase